MRFSVLLALVAVGQAAKSCKSDGDCASNWVKKSCCAHFKCNSSCKTKRCRKDTCGKEFCGIQASDFKDRVAPAREGSPAVEGMPEVLPTPAVKPQLDEFGTPIEGTGREEVPGRPAREARPEQPPFEETNCTFDIDGEVVEAHPDPTTDMTYSTYNFASGL